MGGTSVICRKSQPSPGIEVPGVRLGRTAVTQSEPSAALPWAAAPHARLALRPCCRSLPAPGMDCGQVGLSQSDSRLGDVELTEFDSTTILSAYDST